MKTRLPVIFSGLAIIMMAISISFTAIFIALALTSFLFSFRTRADFFNTFLATKPHLTSFRSESYTRRTFFFGLFLYLTMILGALRYEPFRFFSSFQGTEISGIFLLLFGLLLHHLIKNDETDRNGTFILRCLLIFAITVILSGVIASFTEFRLARILMGYGFEASAENRPQFLAFNFTLFSNEISIFRPIGFMSTRLNYGGILLFSVFIIAGQTYQSRSNRYFPMYLALFLTGLIVMYLNQTRSIILATTIVVFFALCYVTAKPVLQFFNRFSTRRLILFALSGFLVFILVIIIASGPGSNHITDPLPADQSSGPEIMFQKFSNIFTRQTDYQRPVIWFTATALFLANPLLGTGAGNFATSAKEYFHEYALLHPETWHYLMISPHGHAHNDLLHLLATGGIMAGFFFLAIIYNASNLPFAIHSLPILDSKRRMCNISIAIFLALSLPAFFIAGLFQCYFQTDANVTVFWVVAGIISGIVNRHSLHFHSSHET